MAKKDEKSLSLLKASNRMYEDTKKETIMKMREATNEDGSRKYKDEDINKTISLIEEMQSDIKKQYVELGGNIEDLDEKPNKKTNKKKNLNNLEILNNNDNIEMPTLPDNSITTDTLITHETMSKALYDVIPLPSKGECYKHKIGKVPVSYLTAYDENLIVSPNLYRDGTFIDYLLKEKIMNSNIDPNTLTDGDRDAIILWLRASGYGNEYPITVTDDITGEKFETIIDLSEINFKKFNLKGDENGLFDFILPISKDHIKFKFLTHNDVKKLEMMETMENNSIKKDKLEEISDELSEFVENDDKIDKTLKFKINEAINNINKWHESISDEGTKFTHAVTNKLILSIMSVNDITDRKYINEYVSNMKVKDASALRKYITENEPGLDFNIEIKKPESLGGGSMKIFLSLDQYIFLNIV